MVIKSRPEIQVVEVSQPCWKEWVCRLIPLLEKGVREVDFPGSLMGAAVGLGTCHVF